MSPQTAPKRRLAPRHVLLAGDFAAIFAFALIGREAHGLMSTTDAILGLLWLIVEFGGAWLAAGWLARAFEPTGTVRDFMRRSGVAWLGAAPLGVLLRSFVLGRAVIPTVFALVTLLAGGALVLGWRLVFALVVRGRAGSQG
jgi:hypothetical protein